MKQTKGQRAEWPIKIYNKTRANAKLRSNDLANEKKKKKKKYDAQFNTINCFHFGP